MEGKSGNELSVRGRRNAIGILMRLAVIVLGLVLRFTAYRAVRAGDASGVSDTIGDAGLVMIVLGVGHSFIFHYGRATKFRAILHRPLPPKSEGPEPIANEPESEAL